MDRKIILTDADGVTFNWDYAFGVWMESHGYEPIHQGNRHYSIATRFDISQKKVGELIKQFNESAVLEKYNGTGLYWIEDNYKNCLAGLEYGLKPVLMEHGFNMTEEIPHPVTKVTSWREIYELIIGEK